MKNKPILRILAAILSLILTFTGLPLAIIAEELSALKTGAGGPEEQLTVEHDYFVVPEEDEFTSSDSIVDNTPTGDVFYDDQGFGYRLNKDGESYTLVEFLDVSATDLEIPDLYNGKPVNRIGDGVFGKMTKLQKVTLHDGIDYIGDDVFPKTLRFNKHGGALYIGARYLEARTNAKGESVDGTDYYYLYSAENEKVTACKTHEDTEIVASYAFYNCKALESIEITGGAKQVGFRALRGCDNLKSVILPFAGEVGYGKTNAHFGWAFGARTYGGNISFVPEGLETLIIKGGSLEKNALYGLDGIKHLGLPSIPTFLGYYYGASSYTENINYIPAALTTVEVASGNVAEYAFYQCVCIKEVILGDGVTAIGSSAFYGCTNLKSVTVPDSVSSIGADAFYNCSKLTSITIPDGVTSIGDRAFCFCENLTSITISSDVKSIGDSAFSQCTSLTNVTIPNSVTNIGNRAFYWCTSLKNVTIPNSITSIEEYTFYGCKNLANISIPNSISSIGQYCFDSTAYSENSRNWENGILYLNNWALDIDYWESGEYCSLRSNTVGIADAAFEEASFISIYIPKTVTRIGNSAFYNCFDLTQVTFESGSALQTVGDSAFYYCENLQTIALPNTVKTIGAEAFFSCGISEFAIPEGVQILKQHAFACCYNLQKVTIPASIHTIETNAFTWCESLSRINFSGTKAQWEAITKRTSWNRDSGAYTVYCTDGTVAKKASSSDESVEVDSYVYFTSNGDGTCYVSGVSWDAPSVLEIPATNQNNETVIAIGEQAFYFAYFEKVILPDTVTHIMDEAFFDSSISEIVLSKNLRYIGDGAFGYSYDLTKLVLPSSVESIGNEAFTGCFSLNSITLNEGLKTIGTGAFSYCENLTQLRIPQSVTAIGEGILEDSGIYNTDSNWKNGMLCVDGWVLQAEEGMSGTVRIPDGIKGIANSAFSDCANIEKLIFPASITHLGSVLLGYYYGSEYSKLHTIEFEAGSNLRYISSQAFTQTKLAHIYYPYEKNAWRFVQKATDWNEGIENFTLHFSQEGGLLYEMSDNRSEFFVGEYYFTGKDVTIPSSFAGRMVTEVYDKAFYKATSVEKITVPQTVRCIGSQAFYGCTSLTELYIKGTDVALPFDMLHDCNALQILELPFIGSSPADKTGGYLGYFFGGFSAKENDQVVPKSLSKIVLSNDFSIESSAFSSCFGLETIVLPQNLQHIGNEAFANCVRLSALTIPDSVTTIGTGILENCSNVKTIHIGKGVTNLLDVAARKSLFGINKVTSSLTKYTVSAQNPTFGTDENGVLYELFEELTDASGAPVAVAVIDAPAKADLSGYELPEHIVYIGPYAFAYNNSLRWISLDKVRRIDNNAFFEASSLVAAIFGQSAPSDGYDALYARYVEALIRQDESYSQFIGDQAFMGCSALQFVNLFSDFIISIGDQAFYDCGALTSVQLNKSLEHIGFEAFGGTALEGIVVNEENEHYKSVDKVLYKKLSDGSYRLELYPSRKTTAASSEQQGKVYETIFTLPSSITVSAIESYAFEGAVYLDHVTLDPASPLKVGDYAFKDAQILSLTLGENVSSLGLIRGEGEYTVFDGCEHLTDITVKSANPYYSSKKGVLFDKEQAKLIKYPAAKSDRSYTLPETVSVIASMAFKDNRKLEGVTVRSHVRTVGLEAFYGCLALDTIFFDHVFAPEAVMENAFTTFISVGDGEDFDPRTVIGYSADYYQDGTDGQYGWARYEDSYRLAVTEKLTLEERRQGNGYYAIVVVDEQGVRMGNTHVTLTDHRGRSERVALSSEGIAVFYDLFGAEGGGFAIDYGQPYKLQVEDDLGEYFAYQNSAFYLDSEMRITYVTLTKIPSIQGVSCGEIDINTQRAEINKAQYGYQSYVYDDEGNAVYGVNGEQLTRYVSETVNVTIAGYAKGGWSFLDQNGQPEGGLYQNGKKVGTLLSFVPLTDGSWQGGYELDVSALLPEVEVEARLTAFGAQGEQMVCVTLLNIHIFEFLVSEEDVNLDAGELEMDLSSAGETFMKLFGSEKLNVNLGKNVKFGVSVEDDTVEMTLSGKKSFEKNKAKLKSYKTYEDGYTSNRGAHNKNTYFFTYTLKFKDEKSKEHKLTYNVRFARGTEDSNYYFYRCYVYEDQYKNEVTTFYGAVNGLDDSTAKFLKLKTNRECVAIKALLIAQTHYRTAKKECKDMEAVKKLKAAYIEPLKDEPYVSNSHSVEISLDGKMIFKYDRATGNIKPQKSEIKGTVSYTFKHNSQFVVWVIPIVLEIEAKIGGEVDIKLKFDKEGKVSFEEAKLTLSADLSIRAGVGCSVASVGVYGKVGTVFILEFYPDFGVESWTISGEFGVYMKVLWYNKTFKIYPGENESGTRTILPKEKKTASIQTFADMQSALYLAENYTSDDLDYSEGDVRLVTVGNSIYRIAYVNASSIEGFDAYNYRKLALEKWEGDDWGTQILLDAEHKTNDGSYALYEIDGRCYLLFTQQSKKMTKELLDDSCAASSDMVLKLADVTDPESPTITTVAEGAHYKYLPALTVVGGKLTVVWAENADDNMFGVSPYNYVNPENGESVVFPTTANTLYASVLENGAFGAPVALESGLSAITDLAVDKTGTLCYIVDENGDLANEEDRVLYTLDLKKNEEPVGVNDPEKGGVSAVDYAGDAFIYYYNGLTDDLPSGLYYLDAEKAPDTPLPEGFAPGGAYRIVSDAAGKISALLYVSPHVFLDKTGKECDGSVLYGIFRSGSRWGEPLLLEVFEPKDGRYISSFDACYTAEDRLLITAEFSNSAGALVALESGEYLLEAKITLLAHQVDYANSQLSLTVKNLGAVGGALSCTIVENGTEGVPALLLAELLPGCTAELTLSLEELESLAPTLLFTDEAGTEHFRIDDLDLDHSDVIPMAKQLLLGKTNTLLLAVTNGGTAENEGYLLVRPGNCTEKEMEALDPSALTVIGTAGDLTVYKDGENKILFAVPYKAFPAKNSGEDAILYYELPILKEYFTEDEGLFTIFVTANDALEKGNAKENNLTALSYKALLGALEEGEDAKDHLALEKEQVTLDVVAKEELTLSGVMPFGNLPLGITLEDGTSLSEGSAFLLETKDTSFTLTLKGEALSFLEAGSHTLKISFLDGETLSLTVKVPAYHRITLLVNGTALGEPLLVKEGTIPNAPAMDSYEDETHLYTFLYWEGEDGNGLSAATGDAVYSAVFEKQAKSVTVTWNFLDRDGTLLSVTERYTVGSGAPVYKGTLPTVENYTFIGWDKELSPVTEDIVYTAVYLEDILQGDVNGDRKVTEDDAIYLLMHYHFPEEYPLKTSGDLDGDGTVTEKDAIYLLMHVSFPHDYPFPQRDSLHAGSYTED